MKIYKLPLALIAFGIPIASWAQPCSTPSLSNGNICAGSSFNIQSPSTEIAIYNNSMDVLAIGNTYAVTPASTISYTYARSEKVGAANTGIGNGDYYTTTGKYITFKTVRASIINSVDVYAFGPGNVTIGIKNSGGNIISQKTVNVASAGLNTVLLGFQVPVGNNYKMELISETCGGLFRNSAGQSFPYNNTSGNVSLTGGDYSFLGYYYYFYNWSVSDAACTNTLQVNVGHPNSSIINASFCDTYTSPGGSHTWNTSGTYTDVVQNISGCDSTITFNLTKSEIPSPVITASGNVLATGNYATYQWYLNGQPIAGANAATYTALQNGDYTVEVTNTSGCEGISGNYTQNTMDIEHPEVFAGINIFPNPTADYLNITFGNEPTDVRIDIYTTTGIRIKSWNITNQPTYMVNISDISTGIYFLKIQSGDMQQTMRIIKQ